MLRVKSGPECPEYNLRELTWDSNPNCGLTREREKKKKREIERELSLEKFQAKAQAGLLTEQRIE